MLDVRAVEVGLSGESEVHNLDHVLPLVIQVAGAHIADAHHKMVPPLGSVPPRESVPDVVDYKVEVLAAMAGTACTGSSRSSADSGDSASARRRAWERKGGLPGRPSQVEGPPHKTQTCVWEHVIGDIEQVSLRRVFCAYCAASKLRHELHRKGRDKKGRTNSAQHYALGSGLRKPAEGMPSVHSCACVPAPLHALHCLLHASFITTGGRTFW